MAILAATLQQLLIEDDRKNENSENQKTEKNPFRMFAEMNHRLRQLLVSDILIRFCEQIPYFLTAFVFGLAGTIWFAFTRYDAKSNKPGGCRFEAEYKKIG